MSRRRRSDSDFSSDGDSDDDTNFKRRRQRSNSPKEQADPGAGQLMAAAAPISAQASGYQSGLSVGYGDNGMAGGAERPRMPNRELGTASADMRGERWQQGRPMGNWQGSRGGRGGAAGPHGMPSRGGGGSYGARHSASYHQGGVEPYVPEYTNQGMGGQPGMGMKMSFEDMPAPPPGMMPLPLPFLPAAMMGAMIDAKGKEGPQKGGNFRGQDATGWGGGRHGDGNGYGPRDGGRGPGSDKPRSKATMYLTGLPPDLPDLKASLRQYFSKFGQVVEVNSRDGVDPSKGSIGWVQFAETFQLEAALNSKEPYFDNTYVRAMWANRDITDSRRSRGPDAGHFDDFHPNGGQPRGMDMRHQGQGPLPGDPHGAMPSMANPPGMGFGGPRPPPPPPPREAFGPGNASWGAQAAAPQAPRPIGQRPQPQRPDPAEAKRILDMKQTADDLVKEIARQKEALARLEAKSRGALTANAEAQPAPPAAPSSVVPATPAQVKQPPASVQHGGRGGGRGQPPYVSPVRGRGRRAPVGRGAGRGSWSKLDTRSTTVVRVVDIPAGVDIPILKEHFSKFGEVVEAEADLPTGARITFGNRKQAEAALIGGKKLGEQCMILQWGLPFASTPAAPVSPPGVKQPASLSTQGSGALQVQHAVQPQPHHKLTPVAAPADEAQAATSEMTEVHAASGHKENATSAQEGIASENEENLLEPTEEPHCVSAAKVELVAALNDEANANDEKADVAPSELA